MDYMATSAADLPCGKFYPNGTIILVKPCTVKDIQAYSAVNDRDYIDVAEKMNNMLKECIRIKYTDGTMGTYLDIKEHDRFFLLIKIRELTFQQGKFLSINKICPACNIENTIELKRSNFVYAKGSEKIEKFFDNYDKCYVFNCNGREFRLTMPNVGLQKSLIKFIVEEHKQERPPNVSFMKIMPFILGKRSSITEKEINNEIKNFESLTIEEFQFLNSAAEYIKFGIEELVKNCSACGSEVRTEFGFPDGAASVFVVSDSFERYIG